LSPEDGRPLASAGVRLESGRRLVGRLAAVGDDEPRSPFSRLAVANAFTMAGDALVTMALAGSLFFSISPTAARGRVSLSLLLTIAPFAVVAPLLGPAIDRIRGGRRLMVFMAAAGRAVAAWYMSTVLESLLLFPAAFAMLVLSKTHSVAKSSLVPTVVRSEAELVEANSKLSLGSALVALVAAAPGVAVLKLAGAEWVVRLAAVVFVSGAVASLRIVQIRADDPKVKRAAKQEVRQAGIRPAAWAMGVLRADVGFFTFLAAFALRREGAAAWVFGALLAASMAGTLSGAALAPRLRRRVMEERLLVASLALVVMASVAAGRFLDGLPADMLMAACLGLAASTGKLAFDALVQRDAPDAVQGTWFARFEAAFQLAWVVGALIPVALKVPRGFGYILMITGTGASAISYLLDRRVRHRGSPATEVTAT
jgi:hypothetical protein